MKVLLVSPRWQKFPKWSFHLPQLAPLTVAALSPPDCEVTFVDDTVTPIDFGAPADLIAISAMTAQAARAYELADEFRRRDRTVVLGGVHPSLLPDEALEHADAVVVGEAEPCWPRLLEDAARGTLRRRYEAGDAPGAFCVPGQFPRRDLLRLEGYTRTFAGLRAIEPLQTTRGCVFDCEYCNVPQLYGRRLRSRPLDDVVAEFASIAAANVFIVDNLIYENRGYMLALMERLEPIAKKWFSVGSLRMARDREFVAAMARSGCAFLYVGFDHLYENTYQSVRASGLPGHYRDDVKIHDIDYRQDHVALAREYREAVRIIQDAGIGLFGTFAFGFDTDDESIFDRTLEFALGADLQLADFAILTPYPRSPLRERLEREGRLLDGDWAHHNGCHVVFAPKRMGPERLEEGWRRCWEEFYRQRGILRRLCEAFLPKGHRVPRSA